MRIFAIKDEELPKQDTLGYLLFYEKSRCFYIELPDDADPWETPLLLSSRLKQGEYTINAYWSKIWVQQRIVPPDRQNLGQVLKANGLDEYDEFDLLMLSKGRCAQDNCYLTEIDESRLPESLKKRWEKKIEDVVPIADNHLLVFFRDGMLKKCDVMSLAKGNMQLSTILSSRELFCKVAVQTDGYGIGWGERMIISNSELYDNGVDIPLVLDDFISFIANRVVNSAEAAEILGCSRQNIDDLTRRGMLHPVRKDTRNKLYMKNEVQQRIKG